MSASSIKRQMKEAAGSFNVSSTAVELVDNIVEQTLECMAKRTVSLLKRKKTATDLILEKASPEYLREGVEGVVAKAPMVRVYKSMMDRYGEERPYRMTKTAEDWISNFVNDLVFTLAYNGVLEMEADGKKTIQPNHIKLGHREILVANLVADKNL